MKHSTEDLVNAIAKELATWWKTRAEAKTMRDYLLTDLFLEAFEALEYLYPTEDADDWPGFERYERKQQND